MSVLKRLENIRINEGLKKSEFEKIIGKSSGYIGILQKKGGLPGSDVIIKVSEYFREYSLDWLLTGQGEMKKEIGSEASKTENVEENPESYFTDEKFLNIKKDLSELSKGMKTNFETLNKGVLKSLMGQQKILGFIEDISAKEINSAAKSLSKFLEEHK